MRLVLIVVMYGMANNGAVWYLLLLISRTDTKSHIQTWPTAKCLKSYDLSFKPMTVHGEEETQTEPG